MKPNQCRRCKQFRKPENIIPICNPCLVKNENKAYGQGFDAANLALDTQYRKDKRDSFLNGVIIGVITTGIFTHIICWFCI